MAQTVIKRALISVYDKTGLVAFATALVNEFGIEIISTGGTAKLLKEQGLPVTLVEDVTGFPEMMDGRVKTLHPKIHAAILADRDNPEHMRQLAEQVIEPIDMVVVNLYPFEDTVADPNCTFEQAIEMIDIGGPCLLRAAAKNHKHVLPVYDPDAYNEVCYTLRRVPEDADALPELCLRYAGGTFAVTSCYDADVAKWLGQRKEVDAWPWFDPVLAHNWGDLRYGENPHQSAQILELTVQSDTEVNLATCDACYVDEIQYPMSFNNYADANAALGLWRELARSLCTDKLHACVFVKHTNACGVGIAASPNEAYRQAYLGDPNAAMGGILACSFPIDVALAEAIMDTYDRWGKSAGAGGFFVEVWLAPRFDKDAIECIRTRKPWGRRVRLLEADCAQDAPDPSVLDYRSISGGLLAQSRDLVGLNEDQWKVVTDRAPTDAELADLRLAWLVCKHTKSNAITICKDNMLIGNGAGQMSRVMSCRIGTWLAKENGHADQLAGSAAASDAFFPFADGPEILMEAGVKAIIQPGGSKRDADTIDACNRLGAAMIHTGTRHFKH